MVTPKKKVASHLIAPGQRFVFEMAGFDAKDLYRFSIDACDGALAMRFEGGTGKGTWKFTAAALDKARSFLVLSQGSSDHSDGTAIKAELPPFLISRKVFADLAKGPTEINDEWNQNPVEVAIVAKGRAVLVIAGKSIKHDAFKVEGDGISFWVLDDAEWPFIVSREEGGNYWHLLAHGKDVGLDGKHTIGELIVDEEPFQTTKPKAPLDISLAIALLRSGKGTEKKRYEALEILEADRSVEARDALFFLLTDPNSLLWSSTTYALQKRVDEPDFAAALCATISARAPEVVQKEGQPVPLAYFHVTRALDLLRPAHLTHAPLAELVRSLARSHPHVNVRLDAHKTLVRVEDQVMRAELLGALESGKTFAHDEEACFAVNAALASLSPEEASARIEKIFDQPDAIWEAVLTSADRDNPLWIALMLKKFRAFEGDRRTSVGDYLGFVSADGWQTLFDLNDVKAVDDLIALDAEVGMRGVADQIEQMFATVTSPAAIAHVLTLLESERLYSSGGECCGCGDADFLFPMFDAVPADVLAPLFVKAIPKAKLSDEGWITLAQALVDRNDDTWKPALKAVTARIEAKKKPETFDEILATLRGDSVPA